MAGKTFQFRLITPQGKLLDTPATYASLPAHDGLMGIMANRAPIVVKLGMGELRVECAGDKDNGGTRTYLVEDGFAQMVANRLTILTTRAAGAETLTESAAAAELAEAEARRPANAADTTETARLSKDRQRARMKVRLARSKAGKGI